MPIDITREPPITFTEAAAYVPRRRRGRKTSVTTFRRWATVGLRGIRLETIQVGGTKCTSLQALQRFFDRLSCLGAVEADESERNCKRNVERADRELDERWRV